MADEDKVIKVFIDENVVRIEFDEINQFSLYTPNKSEYEIILKKDNSFIINDKQQKGQ